MVDNNNNDDNNDRIHLVTGLLFHACDATEFSLDSVKSAQATWVMSWIEYDLSLDLVEWVRIQFHHKQTSNDLWSSPSIETSNSDSYCE